MAGQRMNISRITARMPYPLREVLKNGYGAIPFRLRLPKSIHRQLTFLEKSQWWSDQEIAHYQNDQLKKLIVHAYTNVPYYRRLFKSIHLVPGDIQQVIDLRKIPILKKEDVRRHSRSLMSSQVRPQDCIKINTSGTTGKPLSVWRFKDLSYYDFDPFFLRYLKWSGYRMGETIATMAGWHLREGQISAFNSIRRLLILSSYQVNHKNILGYFNALKKSDTRIIFGYPSALTLLTKLFQSENRLPPVQIKAILCFAENFTVRQRAVLQDYWGCSCFNHYSLKEGCVFACECEEHGLHACSDYGITEVIDAEIVATSFTNYAMPLIRYATGDLGMLNTQNCSCGRRFPLLDLQGGRERSFAIAKDGTCIPVTSIDISDATEHIAQFQFVQEKRGTIVLYLVKKPSFQEQDLVKIRSLLHAKLKNMMVFDIRFADNILRTQNYKSPEFIQKIQG